MINLTQEQIRSAASVGMKILSDDSVRIPSSMAVSGEVQILFAILRAVVNGELAVGAPTPPVGKEINVASIGEEKMVSRDSV